MPPRKNCNKGGSLLLSKYADRTKTPPHTFSNFPCEVRWIIWELSLEPRTIEIEWTQERGFYSRVATPSALRVNRDSRTAVAHLYTVCFGNPIRPPRTLFHFNLDVVYLSERLQDQVLLFFAGLAPVELDSLQHIGISACIHEHLEYGGETDEDSIRALEQMIPRLKSLKMISVAIELQYNYDGNQQCGSGPCELYAEELPSDFDHDCGPKEDWFNDELAARDEVRMDRYINFWRRA